MNETLQVISKRYSCRDYTDVVPSDEQLRAIGEAALAAPSANNSQRWKIIIVKNKTLIDELDTETMNAILKLPDKTLYNNFAASGVYYHAPAVAFVSIDPSSLTSASLDCGIVSENIALAAESLGLGSCICGLARFGFSEDKNAYFKEKLGFPAGHEFGMSVLLGYAKTDGEPHALDHSKISYIN
ncbi:nitroreductase [Clostridia bacterium]|nr:nitroreductase [Clostridia bacterium]